MSRLLLLFFPLFTLAQQQCYYGPGAQNRGPAELVLCNSTGHSACCLLGSLCLSGNACWDPVTGNTYQYGCTEIAYNLDVCPHKCGFDPKRSPWIALEYCGDVPQVEETWICYGPESCGCDWQWSMDMLVLEPRGCRAMGSDALVALYAPSTLAPYVSLPSTAGGSTGYFSTMKVAGALTWMSTAVPGYTPDSFTQLTTYTPKAPRSKVWVDRDAAEDGSTYGPASSWTGSGPIPTSSNEATTATTSMGSASLTPPQTSSPPEEEKPLTTGAKIGMGISVGLGVPIILLLSLIALYAIRKQTRTQQQAQPPLAQPSNSHDHPSPPVQPQQSWMASPSEMPTPCLHHHQPYAVEKESPEWKNAQHSPTPPLPSIELSGDGRTHEVG